MKDSTNAVKALKYMLLSKIMNNQYEDVYSLINGKVGVKHAGPDIEALKAVTDAYKARSIEKFHQVYAQYSEQLQTDHLISSQLETLQEQLLEQNLLRLLEPFESVQILHVAKLIKLDPRKVEAKLSEMILDHKLKGILDQGRGDLILFPESSIDSSYDTAEQTIKELNLVVDRLYQRANQLTAAAE
jgi:26S proteasome regulatory subunit N6